MVSDFNNLYHKLKSVKKETDLNSFFFVFV